MHAILFVRKVCNKYSAVNIFTAIRSPPIVREEETSLRPKKSFSHTAHIH